ncbi:MAG TPA: hypothetical protein VMZ06_01785 [Candidatus Bathyarchaeia archaeon]|nr:hypothetical protein [Candidatus Bathyarchaeia archaeon]
MRMRTRLVVGKNVPDARGTADWKNFLDARNLARVWGPHPTSPWPPFHCLTLFVALDYLKRDAVGPCDADPWPIREFHPLPWIDASTMLIVDMPGPQSVAFGACLAVTGCDLVCTFNNWPHLRGVIRPEHTLAALLRYASWLAEKRAAFPTPGPVAWLCDAGRLGTRKGKPGQFDNRYYIEDSIMPGSKFLKAQGITKVVYVTSSLGAPNADITVHLREYQKDGLQVELAIAKDDGAIQPPEPLTLPDKSFSTLGFFRSSAGGFGAPVPHPSSGG